MNTKRAVNNSCAKSYKRWTAFSWFLFGLILFAGIGYATTISDTGIYNAPIINNISYVNSISELQSSINENKEVRLLAGNYELTNTINLTSNSKFIIEKGANLRWGVGATPFSLTDNQSIVYNFMFYANNLQNISLENYGTITPIASNNPTGGEVITYINGSDKIYINGGQISSSSEGYAVFNSKNIRINNINSQSINSAVWQECTNNTIIENIQGIAGGQDGEAIDMNGYSQNVVINNVNWIGGYNLGTGSQVVDINSNNNVVINNVIGNGANQALNSALNAGIRFGECSAINGSNVIASNIMCIGCNNTNSFTSLNTTILSNYVNSYGNKVYISANDSAQYLLEVKTIDVGAGRGFRVLNEAGTGVFTVSRAQTQIGNRFNVLANTSSRTCNSGTAGDVYYDGSKFKHYGCNSTTWNALY